MCGSDGWSETLEKAEASACQDIVRFSRSLLADPPCHPIHSPTPPKAMHDQLGRGSTRRCCSQFDVVLPKTPNHAEHPHLQCRSQDVNAQVGKLRNNVSLRKQSSRPVFATLSCNCDVLPTCTTISVTVQLPASSPPLSAARGCEHES